ncbi:MAG: ROK family protein [Bacteroidetes bacterium CHB5]|nr:ROK family protein [Bacteroidetes bacterium CHB5]
MATKSIIGVDMGGTKIQGGVVSGNKLLTLETLPTPAGDSEQGVLNQLIQLIEKLITPNCEGIGIGVPSVVDSKNGIVYDVVAIPSWKEVHLKKILEDHFKIPVQVNNDSNCFALGEKYFGKGQGRSNFVAVTLGTGMGCGIVINNNLFEGANAGAGEIGCIPFREGRVEQYTAGTFFKSLNVDGADLYKRALANDPQALGIFHNYGSNLSEAIKMILYAYDPEVIILGGSISQAYDFFIGAVWKGLDDFLYPKSLLTLKIEKSTLQNSAVWGAAALLYAD